MISRALIWLKRLILQGDVPSPGIYKLFFFKYKSEASEFISEGLYEAKCRGKAI